MEHKRVVIRVFQQIVSLWGAEEGLTTVEYALLLALIVAAWVATWHDFGETLANSADEPIAVLSGAQSGG